jgi:hypothetical protein
MAEVAGGGTTANPAPTTSVADTQASRPPVIDDNIVYDVIVGGNTVASVLRSNRGAAGPQYECSECDFTSKYRSVAIWHAQAHSATGDVGTLVRRRGGSAGSSIVEEDGGDPAAALRWAVKSERSEVPSPLDEVGRHFSSTGEHRATRTQAHKGKTVSVPVL